VSRLVCCIRQWPAQWKRANFDLLQLWKCFSRTEFNEIRTLELPPKTTHRARLHFDPIGGGWSRRIPSLPLSGFFLCIFSFFGYFVTRTGRISVTILTSFRRRMCLLPTHLWGQISKKRQIWGREYAFSGLTRKILKLHIIETTVSIATKFCTVIKTTKYPSWEVQTRASQIQNGGLPAATILETIIVKNHHISVMVWPPRNLARWRNFDPVDPSYPKISTFGKSMMAAAATVKNRKIAISQQRFGRLPRNLIWWRKLARWRTSSLYWQLIIRPFKNPIWHTAAVLTVEKSLYVGAKFHYAILVADGSEAARRQVRS